MGLCVGSREILVGLCVHRMGVSGRSRLARCRTWWERLLLETLPRPVGAGNGTRALQTPFPATFPPLPNSSPEVGLPPTPQPCRVFLQLDFYSREFPPAAVTFLRCYLHRVYNRVENSVEKFVTPCKNGGFLALPLKNVRDFCREEVKVVFSAPASSSAEIKPQKNPKKNQKKIEK